MVITLLKAALERPAVFARFVIEVVGIGWGGKCKRVDTVLTGECRGFVVAGTPLFWGGR